MIVDIASFVLYRAVSPEDLGGIQIPRLNIGALK